MPAYYSIDTLPAFENAVITIGTFDGVHKGHQTILNKVVATARAINGCSIVITFEPHPRQLLFPDETIKLLSPLAQKVSFLHQQGIEHIVVVPFTKAFAALKAEEYIGHFLVEKFHPHTIIIGYDHHFGNDRKGNIDLLKEKQQLYTYRIDEIPAQLIDEAAVSSTKIRNAINEGRVADAGHMLGRYYSVSGIVVSGRQLGRTIGYPTANLQVHDASQIIPKTGIYAVYVLWNNTRYKGMLSIGMNPTVTDDTSLKIEVNIFGFNEDIYGQEIEIQFVQYLRDEQKFASLDDLKEALAKDAQASLAIL